MGRFLRSPRPRRPRTVRARALIPALCVSLAVAGSFVAAAAAGTPAHGALTASGAFHGTWHQSSVRGQCTISKASHKFGVSINLYYGVTTDSATGKPVGAYPALSVTQLKPSGSTHNVNLKSTKNFELELTGGPSGSSWQSGWGSGSGSPPYHHLGSGTVSFGHSGKTGTVSTTLVHYVGSQHGNVHIKASWNCT
jgi:hypothetical protein